VIPTLKLLIKDTTKFPFTKHDERFDFDVQIDHVSIKLQVDKWVGRVIIAGIYSS